MQITGRKVKPACGGTVRIPWGAEVRYTYNGGYDSRGHLSVNYIVDERGYGVMLNQMETAYPAMLLVAGHSQTGRGSRDCSPLSSSIGVCRLFRVSGFFRPPRP